MTNTPDEAWSDYFAVAEKISASRRELDALFNTIHAKRNTDALGAVVMRDECLEISDNIAADWHHHDDKRGWIADTGRDISDAIRALPIPTHAELLAAAMALPEIKALVDAGNLMTGPLWRLILGENDCLQSVCEDDDCECRQKFDRISAPWYAATATLDAAK